MILRRRPCPPGSRPHTIQDGDTFASLARQFDTSVSALLAANPNVNPDALQIGQKICVPVRRGRPACPEGNNYTVRSGDTFASIARFFQISITDLKDANPDVDPNSLQVGQTLCVPIGKRRPSCPPGSRTYIVRQGDTFYSISRRFNITVEALQRLNPGVNPDAMLVGERICVPR